jgi:endoribonuclease Dicer
VIGCSNLKATYVLGGTTGGGKKEEEDFELYDFETEDLQTMKRQLEKSLTDFRDGKSNILLATSVVEEGLDVPACNVVIRYDFPQTYRAYVQSRGRARQKPARFIIFIKEAEISEKKEVLQSFQDIEVLLREYASNLSPSGKLERIDNETDSYTLIPPLEVEGTGAKITATSAIQRLNFYCSQLPKDDYTNVMPSDYTIEENGSYQTTITLPKLCPIKLSVEGDFMANKKLAKMSAALKALEALYIGNELTDTLLPQFRQKEVNRLLIHPEDCHPMSVDEKLKIPSVFWRKDLKEDSGTF